MAGLIDHSPTEINVVIIGETGTGKNSISSFSYQKKMFHYS
jgi:DNA-binding NtrC family response regulator